MRSGECGGWGKTLLPNSSNFWSTGFATCGQALSWRIGPFLLTNASCRHCSFQCISLICWAYFSDVMVSLGFRKFWWIRLAADHQTVTMTFFWCKFGLLFGRKAMNNLDSVLKSRDITLSTKVRLVKTMVFLVVMYGCESWTIKKTENRRIDT